MVNGTKIIKQKCSMDNFSNKSPLNRIFYHYFFHFQKIFKVPYCPGYLCSSIIIRSTLRVKPPSKGRINLFKGESPLRSVNWLEILMLRVKRIFLWNAFTVQKDQDYF